METPHRHFSKTSRHSEAPEDPRQLDKLGHSVICYLTTLYACGTNPRTVPSNVSRMGCMSRIEDVGYQIHTPKINTTFLTLHLKSSLCIKVSQPKYHRSIRRAQCSILSSHAPHPCSPGEVLLTLLSLPCPDQVVLQLICNEISLDSISLDFNCTNQGGTYCLHTS